MDYFDDEEYMNQWECSYNVHSNTWIPSFPYGLNILPSTDGRQATLDDWLDTWEMIQKIKTK